MGGTGDSKRADEHASEREMLEGIALELAVRTDLLPAVTAIEVAQMVQQTFAGLELAKIARLKKEGVSRRERERKAGAGGTRSKKSASKTSKRADTVEKNPKLADDVKNGELGEEQMDALAHGSEKTDGEAALDDKLIDEVKNAPADEAGGIVSRYLEKRNDENGTESRYDRQRRRRKVTFGVDPVSGCETMTASGDRESILNLRKRVRALADELYKADGGRDLPVGEHPRTHQQRMFDALCQFLDGSHGDKRSAGSTPVRSMIHISLTVDDLSADQIRATVLDSDGYLPSSVLEKYGCCSTIAGTVFDEQGEVLWHGQKKRNATPSQFAALVARDKGCVLCSASVDKCQAHHLMPYNAPGRGETNVEDMALVCADQHHWLHDEQLTLYWQLGPPDPDTGEQRRVWLTRPALPHEIAPKKRRPSADTQKRPSQQRQNSKR